MENNKVQNEFEEGLALLRALIAVPSISKEEDEVADLWENWLTEQGVVNVKRFHNNVYALSDDFDISKPTLLLNSHMDTVKPVSTWTRNPFDPKIVDDKLYGLGSNDAGGSGVCLALTFLKYRNKSELPFNLLFAITAGEEIMGELGMRAFLPYLKEKGLYPDMALVGEPTGCEAAIAERGLVVCDVLVKGISGHAARNEGINSIYRAIEDIERLRNIKFPRESEVLGPVKVNVTMIEAGTQHNVIPDKCKYVIDVRTTDAFSNEETVELLKNSTVWSEIIPRSTRIRASVLSKENPLALAAEEAGIPTFISPTTSDMALMYDIPSIKIGPGRSQRSHTADEFIKLDEIQTGIKTYDNFISALSDTLSKK